MDHNLNDIHRLLSLSRISVIGYTCLYERSKDEIVGNYTKVFPDFSLIKRDIKINQILGITPSPYHLTIDMEEIRDMNRNRGVPIGSKGILQEVKRWLDALSIITNDNYKLIITTQLRDMYHRNGNNPTTHFAPNEILYSCDLAFTLTSNGFNIVKNRFG